MNITRTLLIFAAMSLVLSCAQERIEPQKSGSQETEEIPQDGLSFKAQFEAPAPASPDSPETKTILGDNGLDVLWKVYDAICLFDGEGEPYTTGGESPVDFGGTFVKGLRYNIREGAISEDGRTATFSASSPENQVAEGKPVYWAFTPYIADAAFDFTDKRLIAWLVRYQKGNAGNFSEQRGTSGRYLNFAAGSTTDPENEAILFKNILCHLKFTVPSSMAGKITRIGVHAGSGEYLSGDQMVDLGGDKPATSLRYNYGDYRSGSRYGTMYLFPGHGTGNNANIVPGETFDAGSYYMAIMPGTLKAGLFVTFDTQDGKTYYIDHYSVNTTFVRNKVYNMGELSWNNPSGAEGSAVTLPYALSFLQAQEANGVMTYSDQGSLVKGEALTGFGGNTFTMASGTLAKDKTSGAVLSVQTTIGLGAKNWDSAPFSTWWCNSGGHDPVLTGCFSNRTAQADLPFENYFKVGIPLAQDLPSTFHVSIGLLSRSTSWGLKDWKLYYSNDNKVWGEVETPVDLKEQQGTSASVYPFYTFTIDSEIPFKAGGMLYLKLMPYGNVVFGGSTANGLPGSGDIKHNSTGVFGVHSCVAVYDPAVAPSETPSDAVYFEGFDGVTGGVDYFLGRGQRKRLAGMANLCGDALSVGGFSAENCYSRPGYAQIGYLKTTGGGASEAAIGTLTTPAIGKAGDITLSFKAAAYRNPACDRTGSGSKAVDNKTPDETSITVTILGGGTIDGESSVQIEGIDTEAWQTISLDITGATGSTRIQFSSPSTGSYHRWFLDDICIK